MRNKSVLEAKRFGIMTCSRDDNLHHAASIMVEEDISCLIVTNLDGYLAGIITRTDMLRALCTEDNWNDKKVHECMSTELVTAVQNDSIDDIAQILLDKRIHRLVVIQEESGKKRPIAVISEADLIYHMVNNDI